MDVRRTDIDGVPVFWTESSMPFVAYLLIRMGRVDETLLTSGLSHLLEHVVLSTEWPDDEFNATVTPLVTQFWFGGEQAAATDRLMQTLAAISEPPLPRIPREREILRTEAYGRGRSEFGTHSALRFGPLGIGLSDFPRARSAAGDLRRRPRMVQPLWRQRQHCGRDDAPAER